jgi:hypothetical protein
MRSLAQADSMAFLHVAGESHAVVGCIYREQRANLFYVAFAFLNDGKREFKTGTGQSLGIVFANVHAI